MTNLHIFNHWNELKKELSNRTSTVFFSEREIWWCSLGKNIGHEQDGKNALFERPILIIKKFNKKVFLGIPLSTKIKRNLYYYTYNHQGQKLSAIISQVRLLDVRRLHRKMGTLNQLDFENIKNKIKSFL